MSNSFSGFIQTKAWLDFKQGPFAFIVWQEWPEPTYEAVMFYAGGRSKKGGYETREEACAASLERAIKGTEMLLEKLVAMREVEDVGE